MSGKKTKIVRSVLGFGASLGGGMIVGAVVGGVLPPSALPLIPKTLVYLGLSGLAVQVGEQAQTGMNTLVDSVSSVVDTFKGEVAEANAQVHNITSIKPEGEK